MSDDFSMGSQPDTPEYLEQGAGQPLPPEPARAGRSGRKAFLIGGAAVGGLALVGAGTWAAMTLLGGGPQPSEALPASTLAYLSIDLDPSASQKIEALKMLKKFPAFEKEMNLSATDDLRRELFDRIQKDAGCDHIDYADDIEPWLGDRAAVAAIDSGDTQPDVAVVIQINDEAKADAGLTKIRNCAATGDADEAGDVSEDLSWATTGGWLVLAETKEIAQGVIDDAAKGSLADDATYRKWIDEVGDPGIMTMYASPKAGEFMLNAVEDVGGLGLGSASATVSSAAAPAAFTGASTALGTDDSTDPPVPEEMRKQLEEFQGAAGTVRFNDGSLEMEFAGASGDTARQLMSAAGGADLLGTLPEDTAAAMGFSLGDGWVDALAEQVTAYSGDDMTVDDFYQQMSQETGLDMPADLETLMGDAMVVSMSSDIDLDAMSNADDLSGFPIAVKIKGDAAGIETVLDKIRAQMPADQVDLLETATDGDIVVLGPNADYRDEVAKAGTLGSTSTFQDVVKEADQASVILYVDFDAGDNWLVSLAGDDQEAADNLEPLSGFGMSTWVEGDASHVLLRLTTD